MKTCTKCLIIKDKSCFYARSNVKDKLHSWCKECTKNIKSWKKYQRKYSLKKRYNITIEEYNELIILQEAKCKICGTKDAGATENFAVDHDHKTGHVRGLLCMSCNIALGLMKDNVDILEAAIVYLNEGEKQVRRNK